MIGQLLLTFRNIVKGRFLIGWLLRAFGNLRKVLVQDRLKGANMAL